MLILDLLVVFILSVVLGLFFVLTKLFYQPTSPDNQSIIGLTVTFTSLVFGLLLGFTVSNFWNRYIEISDFITEEAESLKKLYRVVKDYPNTENIVNAIQNYTDNTINSEWKLLEQGKFSAENENLFKNITTQINEYIKQNPDTPLINSIYNLIPERDKLKNTLFTNFTNSLILIVIVSALVTLIGFWLLRNVNFYIQFIIDVGIILIIVLSVYLLYELSNPFKGVFKLEPVLYEDLFNEIDQDKTNRNIFN
jgi:ABC-type multidrug transport system fused ATPase/permease subunit